MTDTPVGGPIEPYPMKAGENSQHTNASAYSGPERRTDLPERLAYVDLYDVSRELKINPEQLGSYILFGGERELYLYAIASFRTEHPGEPLATRKFKEYASEQFRSLKQTMEDMVQAGDAAGEGLGATPVYER